MNIPPYTAFSGTLSVYYGQAYVLAPECDMLLPEDAFAGQRNGLCGGAVAGGLFLTMGVHSGYVKLCVQIHHVAPSVDANWDEIVETGWLLNSGPVVLQDWEARTMCEIPLEPGSYRVRYSACRFGQGKETSDDDSQEPVESYLLAFWPAPHAADTVLKQTSEHAAYWNAGAWPTMKR